VIVSIPNPNAECFISYCWMNSKEAEQLGQLRNEKAVGTADPRKVAKYLEANGISVWLDVIKLGKQGLYTDIAAGLSKAKVVLVFMSDQYAKSANCRMELRHALKSIYLPVMVVRINDATLEWPRMEVGMLVSECPQVQLVGDNEEILKKIVQFVKQPDLRPKITNPLASLDHMLALTEELQGNFLRCSSKWDQGKMSFPRLFYFLCTEPSQIRLDLLCEHPGGWHQITQRGFIVQNPKVFVEAVAPYFHYLQKVSQCTTHM